MFSTILRNKKNIITRSNKDKSRSTRIFIEALESWHLVDDYQGNNKQEAETITGPLLTETEINKTSEEDEFEIIEPDPDEIKPISPQETTYQSEKAPSFEPPPRNRSKHIFDFLNKSSDDLSTSFHSVEKVRKKNPGANPNQFYFFKHNALGSLMPPLEATACGFYQFIAPNNVSSSRAHYDEKSHYQYVGVSSKAMPHFKSILEDPLTDADLDDDDIVKGLAIALTTSYLFEEDDLHRRNMDKRGQRIDFDMSLWPLFSKFKEGRFILDWALREPKENSFVVTEKDIRQFPNIEDATPFYWPTKCAPYISEYLPISKNSFTPKENVLYKKLAKHPTFIYYKFRTLLKYILSEALIYRNIAKLDIPEDILHENKKILDIIKEHEEKRIFDFQKVLVDMPEFHEFLNQNSKRALNEITAELIARNQKIRIKIDKYRNVPEKRRKKAKYQDQLMSIETIEDNFKKIQEVIKKRTTIAISQWSDASKSITLSQTKRQ